MEATQNVPEPQAASGKIEYWSISVTAYGVKNRCRKTDKHFASEILRIPMVADQLTEDEEAKATAAVRDWIKANMKKVETAKDGGLAIFCHVSACYEEVGDGPFKMRGFRMFDPRNKRWQVGS